MKPFTSRQTYYQQCFSSVQSEGYGSKGLVRGVLWALNIILLLIATFRLISLIGCRFSIIRCSFSTAGLGDYVIGLIKINNHITHPGNNHKATKDINTY
jgi:hypothetical protein